MKATPTSRKQPKFEQACARLHELALQAGEGAKMPTMSQMRGELGVSLMTLDRALGELETRGVVRRVQGSGIYVEPSLQPSVAFVCAPELFSSLGHSPFWDLLLRFARERAASRGERLDLHFVPCLGDDEALPGSALMEAVRQGRVQGVMGLGLGLGALEWFRAHDVPLVVPFNETAPWSVNFDFLEQWTRAAQQLRGKGCRKIAFWRPRPPVIYPDDPRIRNSAGALCRAFEREAGKQLFQAGVRDGVRTDNKAWQRAGLMPQEQGFWAAHALLLEPRSQWPDGVFIADDMMTAGVLNALGAKGVRAGRDLHIVTHANAGSPSLLGREGEVARLELSPEAMVRALFERLDTLMRGDTPPQNALFLPPVLRDETGSAPSPQLPP